MPINSNLPDDLQPVDTSQVNGPIPSDLQPLRYADIKDNPSLQNRILKVTGWKDFRAIGGPTTPQVGGPIPSDLVPLQSRDPGTQKFLEDRDRAEALLRRSDQLMPSRFSAGSADSPSLLPPPTPEPINPGNPNPAPSDRQSLLSRGANQGYGTFVNAVAAHPLATIEAGMRTPNTTQAQIDPFAKRIREISQSDHSDFVKSLLAGYATYQAGNAAIAPGEEKIAEGFGVETPAPAQGTEERIADATGHTAGFLAAMAAGGQFAPEAALGEAPAITNTATSAIVGAAGGERMPGETAGQVGAFGAINALPLPTLAKIPLEMAAGTGIAAASGGDTTDQMIGGMMPLGFHAAGALGKLAAPATEATPVAPPTEPTAPPAATQTETTPQSTGAASNPSVRLAQIADTSAPVTQRTGLDSLMSKAKSLLTDESGGIKNPFRKAESAPSRQFSSEDMLDYIKLKSDDVDEGGARQLLGDKQYEKRDIPIDNLQTRGNTDLKQGQIAEYAKQPAKTAPAVVADETGTIIDGNRRLEAARLRGDKTVSAYVPVAETPAAPDKFADITNMEGEASKALAEDQGTIQKTKSLLGSLKGVAADESGGMKIPQPVKDLGQNLHDWVTGGNIVRKVKGAAEFDTAKAVGALKPFTEAGGEMDEPSKTAWIENFEKNGTSNNPALDAAVPVLQKINTEIRARANSLGVDTSGWTPNYLARMAKAPEGMSPGEYKSRLTNSESYLKGRTQPTYSDFQNAIKSQGLEEVYKNPIDAQMGKYAEIYQSLAWREQLQKMVNNGTAVSGSGPIPAGMADLPERLNKDPIANKNNESIRVPHGIATAFNNYEANTQPSKGGWGPVLSAARGVRYAVDTYYAGRSIVGAVGHAMGETLGGNFRAANLPGNYLKGKQAIKNLSDMLDDPATKPAGEALERAMKEGSFQSGSLAKPPPPDSSLMTPSGLIGKGKDLLRFLPEQMQKHIVQPLKIGAIMQQAEYARSQGWDAPTTAKYLTEATRTIDSLMGAPRSAKTLPPALQATMDILTPTIQYHTAGARIAVEGATNLAQGKFKSSPSAKASIGQLLAAMTLNTIAQTIATKYHTGKAEMPKDAQDLMFPRTGEKNPDGTDRRMAVTSSVTPMAESIEQLGKSGIGAAIKPMIDPLVFSSAEAINNQDYRGTQIGGFGARLVHALSGAAPILPTSATGGRPQPNIASQLLGVRGAPQAVERTAAENKFAELKVPTIRTPEQADKSDLMHTLENEHRSNDSQAYPDTRAALKAGTISNAEAVKLEKKAQTEVGGFAGRIKDSELNPDELMQVWGKMNPQERQTTAWVMRSKINASKQISDDARVKYSRQINQDIKP